MKHTLLVVMAGLGTLTMPTGCNTSKPPTTPNVIPSSGAGAATTSPETNDAPTPDCPAGTQQGAACDGSIAVCVLKSERQGPCPDPMYDCYDGKWEMMPMPTCNPPPPPPRPKPIEPPQK